MTSIALLDPKIIEVGSSVLVEHSDGSKKTSVVKVIKFDLTPLSGYGGDFFPIYIVLEDGEDHWIDLDGNSLDDEAEISYIDKSSMTLKQVEADKEDLLASIKKGDFAEFRDGSKLKVEFIVHMPLDIKPYDYLVCLTGREARTYTKQGWLDSEEFDQNNCDIIAVHKLS